MHFSGSGNNYRLLLAALSNILQCTQGNLLGKHLVLLKLHVLQDSVGKLGGWKKQEKEEAKRNGSEFATKFYTLAIFYPSKLVLVLCANYWSCRILFQ